jgi:hypothetical protein
MTYCKLNIKIMKVFVVMEKSSIDYENHSAYPIGVYTTKEAAEIAIELARLMKDSPNCITFEEYLDEVEDQYSPEDARHHYNNYQNSMVDPAEYDWYVKEFGLDGA